jgi:hypothetical protein
MILYKLEDDVVTDQWHRKTSSRSRFGSLLRSSLSLSNVILDAGTYVQQMLCARLASHLIRGSMFLGGREQVEVLVLMKTKLVNA